MDGHPRQNPAYRPATEKALATGLFLCARFAGDSSGSPRGGLTAVFVEPLGAVARLRLAGCAGYEPLRTANRNTVSAFRDAQGSSVPACIISPVRHAETRSEALDPGDRASGIGGSRGAAAETMGRRKRDQRKVVHRD